MEQLEIKGYQIRDGCYVKEDVRITEFTLSVSKIFVGNSEIRYRIRADSGGNTYIVQCPQSQINRRRFLADLPLVIHDDKEFYQKVRRAIIEKVYTEEEVSYQTGCGGLQKAGGKNRFVFSNGSIGADGFHPEVYSGIEGMYLPKEAVLDMEGCKKTAAKLFRQYNHNADVFYPLFLFDIMAITNGYFRMIRETCFMKLTLWLDGSSGSGKTELAKAAGNYVFTDRNLNRELISVTDNRKYALHRLSQTSGMVGILDDVKQENTSERKNSSRNLVDDFLRGVFQGKVTDSGSGRNSGPKWIDACAIITGEYLETGESQNARLLYLKVDGFLKNSQNSKALRILQENPTWLTSVCSGYIQWLLRKMEESSFSDFIEAALKSLRSETGMYAGINNEERLNENRHMIEMAAKLSELYFRDLGMPEEFTGAFNRNAAQSIKRICDSTFCLLGGEDAVVVQALERLFMKCRIRAARYRKMRCGYHWKYRQEYFWIHEDDQFVWIEDYQESLLDSEAELHDVHSGQTYLIIRERVFNRLFEDEMQNLLAEGKISSAMAEKILIGSMKLLRKMQVIYKQYRSDSKTWGRPVVAYPVFECRTEVRGYNLYSNENEYDDYAERVKCVVHDEAAIHFNTSHPCIDTLRNRMEGDDMEQEELFEEIDRWEVEEMSMEEIYKMRRSFASSKSLFKK